MSKKINPSWERTKDNIHSPAGIKDLKESLKWGLTRLYSGIAETMFRYDGIEDDKFYDMNVMSQHTMPEALLLNNGQCVWFEWHGAIHCLPMVHQGQINIYGKPAVWSPIPIGWTDNLEGQPSDVSAIRALKLTYEDSVVMKNDVFGGPDKDYINAMVNELVDNTLTMNQLQLLAKAPFVFNVSEDNLLTAKNYFLALSTDMPAIFTNSLGDSASPVVEPTNVTIDTGLFELYDRFECQLLQYLGFPCVPITKRAQQSVSEVQSNDAMVYIRRMEKLKQREMAVNRINELFGTNLSVVSVIDELQEQTKMDEMGDMPEDDMEGYDDA